MCASNFIATLFYSNMTVSLCIRQGSKRNDDSVSVEELDWSTERQVLIPAEHLWCDFKYRPWAKNSSPNTILVHSLYGQTYWPKTYVKNTNDIWVHTVISYTSKLLQQRWKYNLSTLIMFLSLLPQFGSAFFSSKEEVSQCVCPYNECTSHWCLVMSF